MLLVLKYVNISFLAVLYVNFVEVFHKKVVKTFFNFTDITSTNSCQSYGLR